MQLSHIWHATLFFAHFQSLSPRHTPFIRIHIVLQARVRCTCANILPFSVISKKGINNQCLENEYCVRGVGQPSMFLNWHMLPVHLRVVVREPNFASAVTCHENALLFCSEHWITERGIFNYSSTVWCGWYLTPLAASTKFILHCASPPFGLN